jgi:hypothetical protein
MSLFKRTNETSFNKIKNKIYPYIKADISAAVSVRGRLKRGDVALKRLLKHVKNGANQSHFIR